MNKYSKGTCVLLAMPPLPAVRSLSAGCLLWAFWRLGARSKAPEVSAGWGDLLQLPAAPGALVVRAQVSEPSPITRSASAAWPC